jgi:hypothetical protein
MYSKNDYRYYLENQLVHSDDFLAHYGVKGMKWKQHLKKGVQSGSNTTANIALGVLNNDRASDARENAEAIRDNMRHPYLDPFGRNTRHNAKQLANNTTNIVSSTAKRNAQTIKSGSNNKKKKKSNRRPLTLDSFRRIKPRGRKLRGGGNITVTHN